LARFKRSKGFSMIEVLVALVILSIALLALAGLMVTTTKNNSFGNHMTEAATFAQDKLEELRVTEWVDIAGNADTTVSSGITYNRTWTVVPTPAIPNDIMKEITITVTWNDGLDHSISLFSAVTR